MNPRLRIADGPRPQRAGSGRRLRQVRSFGSEPCAANRDGSRSGSWRASIRICACFGTRNRDASVDRGYGRRPSRSASAWASMLRLALRAQPRSGSWRASKVFGPCIRPTYLRLRSKFVSDAVHGEKVFWFAAVVPEFFSQLHNHLVERAGGAIIVVTPDLVQQAVP